MPVLIYLGIVAYTVLLPKSRCVCFVDDSYQLTELFLELTLDVVSRTIPEARYMYVCQRSLTVVIIVYCVLFSMFSEHVK